MHSTWKLFESKGIQKYAENCVCVYILNSMTSNMNISWLYFLSMLSVLYDIDLLVALY